MHLRKKHAEHNEEACRHIHESKKYPDWVITTAFYSALHYILYQIFPLEEDGEIYESFSRYYSEVIVPKALENDLRIKKHDAQLKLVKIHIPNAYGHYRFLYEHCMNARYNDYNVVSKYAGRAIKRLEGVKNTSLN